MAKKRVYVETSVISDLTARPAKKPIPRLRQLITADWWERRSPWDYFLTATVIAEISRGDPKAAALRQERARSFLELPVTPEVEALAGLLLAKKLVPLESLTDAYHLAGAAFHRADYLLTWNQKHLDNLELRSRIEEFIKEKGFKPAKVLTPARLLEETP